MQGMAPNRTSTIDVPVRILVPSESVGAIIGKGGQTIRQLTQQTRAKVDVFRGDPMAPSNALQEKVITIRGQPENCINACREILKVMKTDAESKGKQTDIPLKVLAHNDYIGRIIGKQGNIINSIKKETETTVTVSSINDISMNVERVITVKGELENMIKALEIIHQKIKSAFENDQKTFGAQAIMMGGIPPILPAAAAAAVGASGNMNVPPFLNTVTPFNQQARYVAAAAAAAAQQTAAANAGPYPNFYTPLFPSIYPQNIIHPAAAGPHQAGPPPPQPPPHQQQQQQQGPPQHPNAHQQQQQQPHQQQSGGPSQQSQQQSNQQSQQNHVQSQQQQQQAQQQQQSNVVASGSNTSTNSQQQNNHYGPELETIYLYIPNVAVGAIIGTKGSFIKNIIKLSGASVKITPLTPEESKNASERQVVITGTSDSQYKAQYYIYEKIRQERFITDDNVKLRVEIQVPSHIVGRIIGKSGKNVRDLQRSTGATIKLPDDAQQQQQQAQQQQQQQQLSPTQQNSPPSPTAQQQQPPQQLSSSPVQYVTVRIYGTFNSSQLAQRRIQTIVLQSLRGTQSMPSNRYSNPNFQQHQQHQHNPYQQNYMKSNGGGRPNRGNRQYNNYNNNNNNNNQSNMNQQQQQQQQQQSGSGSNNASSPITNNNTDNEQQQQQQQQQIQNDSSSQQTGTTSPTPTN